MVSGFWEEAEEPIAETEKEILFLGLLSVPKAKENSCKTLDLDEKFDREVKLLLPAVML